MTSNGRRNKVLVPAVAALSVLALAACSNSGSSSTASGSSSGAPSNCITGTGWTDANRQSLNNLIGQYAGQHRAAIFDWDNTSQARDIGAASFSQLYVNGQINNVPAAFMPTFTQKGQKVTAANIVNYTNSLGNFDDVKRADTDLPQNMFEAQLFGMIGMTPQQISTVQQQAYDNNAGMQDIGKNTLTQIGTGAAAAPRPFIYPEMVELYGCLITNGFDVRITSASDVWTVRSVVRNFLNPEMQKKFGPDVSLPAQNVMGISFTMIDTKTGTLVDDASLVRLDTPEGKAYAAGEPGALSRYKVSVLSSGIPTDDAGKPANVLEWVTPDIPVLVCGDSNGDFLNFTRAENRLWIARLTEPSLQKLVVPQYQNDGGNWMVQPTLYEQNPGYVPSQENLNGRLAQLPASQIPEIAESIDTLNAAGMLPAGAWTPPPTASASASAS